MKRSFFQAAVTSILLYGCTTWTLTKRLEKKLDGNYTRMLRAFLNKSWQQHPTRHQLYGHLPPITKTIQVRRTRHAGHCWRSRDELIRDVLLWIPTHGRAKAGRPARTYIQQLCEDTGCCPEDLPRAMNDREEWRERVRDIRATSTRWWWWWYIYMCVCVCVCISILMVYLTIYERTCSSGCRGLIRGLVITKTQNVVLDAALTPSIIRHGPRVNWLNQRNGVGPSPITMYWKVMLRVTHEYVRQVYLHSTSMFTFWRSFWSDLHTVIWYEISYLIEISFKQILTGSTFDCTQCKCQTTPFKRQTILFDP